jgi:hypothetical protein
MQALLCSNRKMKVVAPWTERALESVIADDSSLYLPQSHQQRQPSASHNAVARSTSQLVSGELQQRTHNKQRLSLQCARGMQPACAQGTHQQQPGVADGEGWRVQREQGSIQP